jgi:hypothetical protein
VTFDNEIANFGTFRIQILAEQKTNWRKKKIENTKPTGKDQIVHEELVQCNNYI